MPRHPDPELEQRILEVACRLWARGGTKALTMRAVARAAGTTTPTVYERYRDREDLLRGVRLQTRRDLFASMSRSRTLAQACERYLHFALDHPHAFEMLFDRFAQPPSLHEPWPSFNLMRHRLAQRLGGTPHQHTRLMLSLWSLMHGTAMLMIRGEVEGSLRTQMFHACLDALEDLVRRKGRNTHSGPKWPSHLILGEAAQSRVGEFEPADPKPALREPPKKRPRRRLPPRHG
ncbi:MAG TPA: TetR/AcrR family transcriptional regulator [Candidatus Sulfotelmatobacter sp.]